MWAIILYTGFFLSLTWLLSVFGAWLFNREDIKRTYSEAPFNWRVFGYRWTYLPWLEARKRQRENG